MRMRWRSARESVGPPVAAWLVARNISNSPVTSYTQMSATGLSEKLAQKLRAQLSRRCLNWLRASRRSNKDLAVVLRHSNTVVEAYPPQR